MRAIASIRSNTQRRFGDYVTSAPLPSSARGCGLAVPRETGSTGTLTYDALIAGQGHAVTLLVNHRRLDQDCEAPCTSPTPSSGQPAGPLRLPAPAPVRTAVKLMYAGAAVSAAGLIIGLALIIADIEVAARGQFLGHSLAAHNPLVITVWMVFGLLVIALWLWMVRATGRGRAWARVLSMALFGLAT